MFGCKASAHISKEKRQKLDMKSILCIFIGYGDEKYEYRLWDPANALNMSTDVKIVREMGA